MFFNCRWNAYNHIFTYYEEDPPKFASNIISFEFFSLQRHDCVWLVAKRRHFCDVVKLTHFISKVNRNQYVKQTNFYMLFYLLFYIHTFFFLNYLQHISVVLVFQKSLYPGQDSFINHQQKEAAKNHTLTPHQLPGWDVALTHQCAALCSPSSNFQAMFFYLSLLSTPCLRGRLRQNTALN